MRPPRRVQFERRFETPPGRQAQVDFAEFKVEFDDEPGVVRKVWLFTLVLGHSRWLWGRFCADQDPQTVLRCHIDAFAAMAGAPLELLYDRMKTAVVGEGPDGVVSYNTSLVALLNHYGAVPRACRPYRAKTKGKVERPYRYVRQDFFLARRFRNLDSLRQDFFLARRFRNLDSLNAQFDQWRTEIANARVHATTGRVVTEHFAEERPALIAHPAFPYSAVLTVERRVSHEGMVSVGGNLYSVPDATRKRVVEVQSHPKEVRIFEDGVLIAAHPLLEGRNRRRIDPAHRKTPPARSPEPRVPDIRRPLSFLRRRRPTPRDGGRRAVTELLDRIRATLVGLRMPRALEALEHTVRRLERGELSALEALDGLLAEEHATREGRRIGVALKTARLMPPKTLESFDFTFQPSLDRSRILALAQLDFVARAEVVHFLGPPGTGKSHLATALGVAAVKAGRSVYRCTLAELVEALGRAEREGRLLEKIRLLQ